MTTFILVVCVLSVYCLCSAFAVSVKDIEKELNATRIGCGLPTLSHCDKLTRLAQEHASSMATIGKSTHSGFNERYLASGYLTLGENVTMNGGIQSWMHSPGHRHNLLRRSFTHVGTGISSDKKGNYYICQLYGTKE